MDKHAALEHLLGLLFQTHGHARVELTAFELSCDVRSYLNVLIEVCCFVLIDDRDHRGVSHEVYVLHLLHSVIELLLLHIFN